MRDVIRRNRRSKVKWINNLCTSVASLFLIINDRNNVLLSLVLRTNESGREMFDPLGVTFMRKTCSWYNGAVNLISRITLPVLRSEMRLVMPRCIKFKWNGAKVAHCIERRSEGGTSRQKMSSWRKEGKGQRLTIKSSYYPYYRRRCERTRTRRLRRVIVVQCAPALHSMSFVYTYTERSNNRSYANKDW